MVTDDRPSIANPIALCSICGHLESPACHRPSVTELQQVIADGLTERRFAPIARILNAAPVLMEIAAAALASRKPIKSEQDAREVYAAFRALDDALSKVAP